MLTLTHAESIFANVNGSSFVGIDTLTEVPLTGGKSNPMKGRVTKRMTGASVMVFQNKNINGYKAMVERRLAKEGKPTTFKLSPRKWGTRLADTPFVEYEKDGSVNHYLEVIFLKAGEVEYLLDGKPVNKANIVGLKSPAEHSGQGGLEDQVTIRSFKFASIVKIRIDKTEYSV